MKCGACEGAGSIESGAYDWYEGGRFAVAEVCEACEGSGLACGWCEAGVEAAGALDEKGRCAACAALCAYCTEVPGVAVDRDGAPVCAACKAACVSGEPLYEAVRDVCVGAIAPGAVGVSSVEEVLADATERWESRGTLDASPELVRVAVLAVLADETAYVKRWIAAESEGL